MNTVIEYDSLFVELCKRQLVNGFLDVFHGMFLVFDNNYAEIGQFCDGLRIGYQRTGGSIDDYYVEFLLAFVH